MVWQLWWNSTISWWTVFEETHTYGKHGKLRRPTAFNSRKKQRVVSQTLNSPSLLSSNIRNEKPFTPTKCIFYIFHSYEFDDAHHCSKKYGNWAKKDRQLKMIHHEYADYVNCVANVPVNKHLFMWAYFGFCLPSNLMSLRTTTWNIIVQTKKTRTQNIRKAKLGCSKCIT